MNVLVTGVHIDDCEAMGGTVKLLADMGVQVTFLNLKPYMHYKGRNYEADIQSIKGAEILGAKKITFDYNDTKYYKTNEKTIRMTEELIREIKPDIIFMMHPKDNHIEHIECSKTTREAIFAAAVDGICPNEIYSYECGPMQTMCYFQPDLYINVESVLGAMKESALTFNLNHANGAGLWDSRQVKIRYRGGIVGLEYAEAFKIIKYPKGGNDFILRELLQDKFRWNENGMYLTNGELFL